MPPLTRAYLSLLQRHPHAVNAVVASGLAATGDVCCQLCEGGGADAYEPARTARLAAYRLCVWGPAYSAFVASLERVVGRGTSTRSVVQKVARQPSSPPPFPPLSLASYVRRSGDSTAVTVRPGRCPFRHDADPERARSRARRLRRARRAAPSSRFRRPTTPRRPVILPPPPHNTTPPRHRASAAP